MAAVAVAQTRAPHPVFFDVPYPGRVSRLTTLIRIILAIPQVLVAYALLFLAQALAFFAWFVILFTGRYPTGIFQVSVGAMRWAANVFVYVALLRDEYPPFSWDLGAYRLVLVVPYPERQSRWRLFIRLIAIWPNVIVLYFIQFAFLFTTIIAWFAILITGRYPRGLFEFGVGVIRWYQRQWSYLFLLRDEYPPYSIGANARPGNEMLSLVLGVPVFALWLGLQLLPFAGVLARGSETVRVQSALTSPALAVEAPSSSAGGIRVTLAGYNDHAPRPGNVTVHAGERFVSFRVRVKKDSLLPTFFVAGFFHVHDCDGFAYALDAVTSGLQFDWFWIDGHDDGAIVFQMPDGSRPCDLTYQAGASKLRFLFAGS